jgi:hypothetical protein
MRTILSLALGMVLVTGALAQEVDVCGEIYAPWGSDVNTVIRAGAKANLNFNEVTKQDSDGIIQLSFLNGSVARVFTFMYGKYVSFSLLNMDSDAVKRNRYTAKQMNMVLRAQSELNDEGAWVVACGTSTVKATLSTTRDQSSFRVMSMTALEALVDSKD